VRGSRCCRRLDKGSQFLTQFFVAVVFAVESNPTKRPDIGIWSLAADALGWQCALKASLRGRGSRAVYVFGPRAVRL
jgi:hypothetical protein